MKKITFWMILAVMTTHLIACEEEWKETPQEAWQYHQPYFELEYAADTIRFGSADRQMNMSVADLKALFGRMAADKMQDYFKGIDFYTADTLLIKAQRASGEAMNIRASYLKDHRYLEIKLNAEDMKTLIGENAPTIPAISFQYLKQDNQLTVYLNEVYVQSIFENQQIQNMLMPIIGRALNPQFDRMPPQAQQAMLAGIKQQISSIIDAIQTLKIGFVLQ